MLTSPGDDADAGVDLGGNSETSLRVVLPRKFSHSRVYFRLRARRGLIVSEPSATFGPVDTCEAEPMHSPGSVFIASGIALALLLAVGCFMCRRTSATTDDGFSKEKPPK